MSASGAAPAPTAAATSARMVRMAVISDVHAVSKINQREISYARKFKRGDGRYNALDAAKELFSSPDLEADVLLCPGDLADSTGGNDPEGMAYAWGELQALAQKLGGATLIATAGNHDIVRWMADPADEKDGGKNTPLDFDVSIQLKDLDPPFPTTDAEAADVYFVDDFLVVTSEHWRVVSLNSCAEANVDPMRGSVRSSTIENIAAVLEQDDAPPVNVFMCHHHPVEWTHLAPRDTSHMQLGEQLLRMLDQRDTSRWVFVHGHRHQPTVGYAGESTSGPVRFSAGSISCVPWMDTGPVRNQLYMLEFDIDELEALSLPGAGRFISWDWRYQRGMRPAAAKSGLPHQGGFGFRRDGFELAATCVELGGAAGTPLLHWDDLIAADARWKYVAPLDLHAMQRELRKLGGEAFFADDGTLAEVNLGGS